jgi:hypothetical protein
MASFETQRLAVIVYMRTKIVYIVNNESAIRGSLEHSINLVITRYSSFPLSSEE